MSYGVVGVDGASGRCVTHGRHPRTAGLRAPRQEASVSHRACWAGAGLHRSPDREVPRVPARAPCARSPAAPRVERIGRRPRSAAEARDTAVRYAETTRDWATPKVIAAKEWAAPRVEPAVDKVKDDVLPAVAGAVTAALAASEPARAEAATPRHAPPSQRSRARWPRRSPRSTGCASCSCSPRVLGGAYAGWKAWAAKNSGDPVEAWSTPSSPSSSSSGATVTPVPAAPTTSPSAKPATDDAAGAGPDEALADAADEAKAEDEAPGQAASATKTTEPVTPKNARKSSSAAKKSSPSKS